MEAGSADTPDAGQGGSRAAHRPGRYADLTGYLDAMLAPDDGPASQRAAETAAAVLRAGRDGVALAALADQVGLDTLAQLWRDADPVSLAGVLWTLYLLRQWCYSAPEEVVRLWRAGQPHVAVDEVVAGLPDYVDADGLHRVIDAVLEGAYRGDFGVALERAAATFRVIAAGRRELAGDGPAAVQEAARAARNEHAAADLSAAARRWRAGRLE